MLLASMMKVLSYLYFITFYISAKKAYKLFIHWQDHL